MSNWRSSILRSFAPKVARLTLVADPDGLLSEEKILQGIRAMGLELIAFEDPISFRYSYESRFRSRWDRGEQAGAGVVVRTQMSDLSSLPYDLLQAGRRLSFNLGDLFPGLSYPVVASLDRADLDALYDAHQRYAPAQLGDNATKDFILRHVFGIAPEIIDQASDLLRILLRRHCRNWRIPATLDNRLIQLLRKDNRFRDWPLEVLVADSAALIAFLQERWPIFLDSEAAKAISGADGLEKTYSLCMKGPVSLPFDDDDVRVYVEDLFAEGLMRPVLHEPAGALSTSWAGIGILNAPAEDRSRRIEKLVETLEESLPGENARHSDWLRFARGWGELIRLRNDDSEPVSEQTSDRFELLQSRIDTAFTTWLLKWYAGLANLPPVPPVMLHHVPRLLASRLARDNGAKVALVLVDGLAMDQWLIVRDVLSSHRPQLEFREQAVFAWVPSLTSISRQATFAGKVPAFFPASIQTTEKEPALWTQFWGDQGYASDQVVYMKGLGDGGLDTVADQLTRPHVKVAGLVINKVDRIMHGMEMGTAGMHNQVRQWARQPYLGLLLDLLLDGGFHVCITSDHGNIEATGCGRPAEGALADQRGERVRIYPNAVLRASVQERFPAALAWDTIGLPENCLALFAPSRQAFVSEQQRTVCHGGVSIEEVIVPLVDVERHGI